MWLCGILPSKASKYESERLPPYTPGPKVESTAEKQPSIASPTCLSAAEEFLNKAIDDLSGELRELSLKIWEHPQLAWHETYASKEASHFMEEHGFRVSLPAYDLPTAFEAIFEHKADTKGAVCVGFNSEYDALPEIGQACGHNLICIGGIAPAIACAKALVEFDIPGKVVLLGTPAEEKDGGKIDLLKRGAYKQMDICLMLHPSPVAGLCKMLAVSEVKCEFFGKGAHAAGAPWLGINALEYALSFSKPGPVLDRHASAAISAYNSISMLRQQTEPTARMHGLVRTKEGAATNIIPDWAQLDFGVRTVELGDLEALKKKMERILEAAASSTGCTLKYSWEYTYFDVKHNPKLGEAYTKFMKDSQGIQLPDPINFGSTDFGNVSYELPALHPIYAIATEGVNHTPEFTAAAKTMEAHIETLKSSKGLAATAWKAVTDATFLKEVKQAFEDDKKQNCLGTVQGNRKRGLWRR